MPHKYGIPAKALTVLAVMSVALLGGCVANQNTGQPVTDLNGRDTDIIAVSYTATERLLNSSTQVIDRERPILVASLVNIANLEQSSNLGRIISEQVSSRLTQLGYQTREMKFRGSFLIKQGAGEFVLSRALRDISQKQEAQAVVTGVYTVAQTYVLVTLRLIRAEDSTVISSYDFKLPLGPNTLALLDPFRSQGY